MLADGEWHSAKELVQAAIPAIRPEIAFRNGLRLSKRLVDPTSLSALEVDHYVVRGAAYLALSPLRSPGESHIETLSTATSKRYRWVRNPDKRCLACGTLVGDKPLSSRRYCDSCGPTITHPRTLAPRVCPGCQQPFQPNDGRQKNCSQACSFLSRPNYGRRGRAR